MKRHPSAVAEFLELEPFGKRRVTVGIEDGDRLWQRLWKNAGAKVFVFDGKKARRFSESLHSSGARDDKRAAKDLLEMVKSKAHREHASAPRSTHEASLLQMDVEIATKKVVEHEGRLVSLLKQYHPALVIALQKRMRNEYALRIIELCPTAVSFKKLGKTAREEVAALTQSSRTAHLLEAAREDWGAILSKDEPGVARLLRAEVGSLRHALLRKRAANEALAEAAEKSPLRPLVGDMKGVGPYTLAALTIAADDTEGTVMASPSYLVQLQSPGALGSSATPAHPWPCGAHVRRRSRSPPTSWECSSSNTTDSHVLSTMICGLGANAPLVRSAGSFARSHASFTRSFVTGKPSMKTCTSLLSRGGVLSGLKRFSDKLFASSACKHSSDVLPKAQFRFFSHQPPGPRTLPSPQFLPPELPLGPKVKKPRVIRFFRRLHCAPADARVHWQSSSGGEVELKLSQRRRRSRPRDGAKDSANIVCIGHDGGDPHDALWGEAAVLGESARDSFFRRLHRTPADAKVQWPSSSGGEVELKLSQRRRRSRTRDGAKDGLNFTRLGRDGLHAWRPSSEDTS